MSGGQCQAEQQGVVASGTTLAEAVVCEGEYGVGKAEVNALGVNADGDGKEVSQGPSSHTGATNKKF